MKRKNPEAKAPSIAKKQASEVVEFGSLIEQVKDDFQQVQQQVASITQIELMFKDPMMGLAVNVYEALVDSMCKELCLDVHKEFKSGSVCQNCFASLTEVPSNPNVDIFGQPLSKGIYPSIHASFHTVIHPAIIANVRTTYCFSRMSKLQSLCHCLTVWNSDKSHPNLNPRYVPHLEKCLNMGRSSSRRPSQNQNQLLSMQP